MLFTGSPSVQTSAILPVESAGGWSQLKFKPLEKMEFNAAFGGDYPFHSGLTRLSSEQQTPVSRNTSGFFNVIYRPRSILLFSAEYRRLWTSGFDGSKRLADYMSLSSGIVF